MVSDFNVLYNRKPAKPRVGWRGVAGVTAGWLTHDGVSKARHLYNIESFFNKEL